MRDPVVMLILGAAAAAIAAAVLLAEDDPPESCEHGQYWAMDRAGGWTCKDACPGQRIVFADDGGYTCEAKP